MVPVRSVLAYRSGLQTYKDCAAASFTRMAEGTR